MPDTRRRTAPRRFLRLRQFVRALCQRCPLCGRSWPHVRYVELVPKCPVCQLRLERGESDFFLGPFTINLFATLFVAVLLTIANVRWHDLPAPWRHGVTFTAITAFALGFYPTSKLVWLAFDLQFRPPIERDFDEELDRRA